MEYAPEQIKTLTIRSNNPWFNNDVKELKRIVMKREKIRRKYKEEHQWLYSLVNNITGNVKSNPLPDSVSDQDLAERFADFFMEKIRQIQDELDNFPMYNSTRLAGQKLFREFSAMIEDEVEKLVKGLATKNCELDPIPTALLEESLHEILLALMKLINLSLTQGIFIEHWKIAIIRPLVEKIGLELILKNFCPVSNLSFLSKLLEYCALKQFNHHCDKEKLPPDYQSPYHQTIAVKLP